MAGPAEVGSYHPVLVVGYLGLLGDLLCGPVVVLRGSFGPNLFPSNHPLPCFSLGPGKEKPTEEQTPEPGWRCWEAAHRLGAEFWG